MKIVLAQSAGFCYGVRRAVEPPGLRPPGDGGL